MALSDVLSRININAAFGADGQNYIENLLVSLYSGSAKGAALLEKLVSRNQNLTIDYLQGSFKASPFKLEIDLFYLDEAGYIDTSGTGRYATDFFGIVHELVHAIELLHDTDAFPTDPSSGDSAGSTVRYANEIYSELGFQQQLSYAGLTSDGGIVNGFEYTGGVAVDHAFYSDGGFLGKIDTSALGADSSLIISNSTGEEVLAGVGSDFIYGRGGSDTLSSGAGNDVIWGDGPDQAPEADVINAGPGNDVIYFDEQDSIDGGTDWDVAIYSGASNTSTVDMNVTDSNLEVVVAGMGADVLSTDGNTESHLAGLGGADTFHVSAGGGAPTVIWGGADLDTIDVQSLAADGSSFDPTGILVVSVVNLTAETFTSFELDMLGLGAGFDWSEIDVVVFNPESTDRININGATAGTASAFISDTAPTISPAPAPAVALDMSRRVVG